MIFAWKKVPEEKATTCIFMYIYIDIHISIDRLLVATFFASATRVAMSQRVGSSVLKSNQGFDPSERLRDLPYSKYTVYKGKCMIYVFLVLKFRWLIIDYVKKKWGPISWLPMMNYEDKP